ncbi:MULTISPECIES: hypothetical protein [unclassified Mesorhizobium]|uniref:hypothetical protein n=1 Tax=unclassified Mesorhizobium TaxID=325217 RepID=UPI0007ECBE5B|nr:MULTISPECIES: hypothetical protein [unclassified Mesorhizobium]
MQKDLSMPEQITARRLSQIGLGVWQVDPAITAKIVSWGIEAGYRFDRHRLPERGRLRAGDPHAIQKSLNTSIAAFPSMIRIRLRVRTISDIAMLRPL